jgi:hypothetical protein
LITGLSTIPAGAAAAPIATLTLAQASSSITITPSTGIGLTIPEASDSLAGVLDATRASFIDGALAKNPGLQTTSLAAVASSGSYSDLANKLALALVAYTGNYSDLAIRPLATISMLFDGGGASVSAGITRFTLIPFPATITGWTVMADVSGSISIDIWKASFANFPPTVSNTIVNGYPLVLSSAQSAQGSVANWSTVTINAGDVLAYHVTSASTVTAVTAQLTAVH